MQFSMKFLKQTETMSISYAYISRMGRRRVPLPFLLQKPESLISHQRGDNRIIAQADRLLQLKVIYVCNKISNVRLTRNRVIHFHGNKSR